MSHCSRINDICQNKRKTIWDTNSFIKYLKYLSLSQNNRFWDVHNNFRDFLNDLCNQCCVENRLYCSNIIFNQEIRRTLIFETPFLNNLRRVDQNRFVNLIGNHLDDRDVNEQALNDLENIANEYRRTERTGVVGRADLSLILVALEDIFQNPDQQFIIVTSDDSLHDFVIELRNRRSVPLAGIEYSTTNITVVTILTYLTTTFKCCKYNQIKELRHDLLFRIEQIQNRRVLERKIKQFWEWIDEVYIPAFYIKQERIGGRN